ncbi:MAG: hypothetical protein AAFN79_14450 [Pseudomonadota bacterium]
MSNPEDRKNAARATEFPVDKTEMYPSQRRRYQSVQDGMAMGAMFFATQDQTKRIIEVSQALIMIAVTLTIALSYGGAF